MFSVIVTGQISRALVVDFCWLKEHIYFGAEELDAFEPLRPKGIVGNTNQYTVSCSFCNSSCIRFDSFDFKKNVRHLILLKLAKGSTNQFISKQVILIDLGV